MMRRLLAWVRRVDCRLCGAWRRASECRGEVCGECQLIVSTWHADMGETVTVPL